MLKGLASYVIVGHSERRALGETDKDIAAKLAAAVRNGLKPILCVGEQLADRQAGLSRKVVVDQLEADLADLAADDLAGLAIAYEPVWAINHHDGHKVHHAIPADFKTILPAIRNVLEDRYGARAAKVRLLYGGSVDADHVRAYLEAPLVNGLLVGTASLNPADFAKIVAATSL
jgi:triosephosphate isomerase